MRVGAKGEGLCTHRESVVDRFAVADVDELKVRLLDAFCLTTCWSMTCLLFPKVIKQLQETSFEFLNWAERVRSALVKQTTQAINVRLPANYFSSDAKIDERLCKNTKVCSRSVPALGLDWGSKHRWLRR